MGDEFRMDASRFDHAVAEWEQRVHQAAKAALVEAAASVGTEMAHTIGSGGTAPQNVSGALAASFTQEPPTRTATGWAVRFGPAGLPYIRRVEMGKTGAHHAPAHPFFRPGFAAARSKFVDVFTRHMRAAQPKGR